MSHAVNVSGVWKAMLSTRSLDARLNLLTRAAAAAVALVLLLALGGQTLAASRLGSLQRESYPALRDTRALATTLAALRDALAAGSSDAAAAARADSLAGRFHEIAGSSRVPGLAAADAKLAVYVVQARRTAEGITMSSDADASSAVAALAAYRQIEAQLATSASAAEQDVAAAIAAADRVQRAIMLLLAIAGAFALLVLVTLGAATVRSIAAWTEGVAGTVDGLARGELAVLARSFEEGEAGQLSAALRRLARQLRENSETAHALAAGSFRRATRAVAPKDPMGLALAQITSNMELVATSAQRIARGDLSVQVVPQSEDDTFGQAHASMTRRIVTTLRDVEATRQSIATTIEAMRGDAASLASDTSADADRLRRAADRLSALALRAAADATRGDALTERAGEREAMLEQGAAAVQASLNVLRKVLQRSESVQCLARSSGLLVVRDGGPRDDEARALAARAVAAAGDITRLMIEGSEQGYESGVAIDRVALAAREGTALVRELGDASRRHAVELHAIDEAVVQVHATTTRSADAARQLASRLDALASHARTLDAVLRRVDKGRAPVIRARTLAGDPKLGPVLYRTPPHTHAVFPEMAVASL